MSFVPIDLFTPRESPIDAVGVDVNPTDEFLNGVAVFIRDSAVGKLIQSGHANTINALSGVWAE